MSIRIVIGGPRNCGKSTLAASIYKFLSKTRFPVGLHEIDVFSDTIPCILGLKPWKLRLKRESGDWQNAAVDRRLDEFGADRRLLVLGDLPGIIDDCLEKMVKPATAAIVVGRDSDGINEWLGFFKSQKIPTIMRILSVNGSVPTVPPLDTIYIKGLDRIVLQNKEIRQVAEILFGFTLSKK